MHTSLTMLLSGVKPFPCILQVPDWSKLNLSPVEQTSDHSNRKVQTRVDRNQFTS